MIPVGRPQILDVPDTLDGEQCSVHVAQVLVLGKTYLVGSLTADVGLTLLRRRMSEGFAHVRAFDDLEVEALHVAEVD